MTDSAFPLTTRSRKAGRYVSRRSLSLTFASNTWRSGSGPLCTA